MSFLSASTAYRWMRGLRGLGDEAFELGEPPLRSALFTIVQLQSHAEVVAKSHDLDPRSVRERLLPRLKENERIISSGYRFIAEAVERGREVAPAADWLIDNFYLIEEQIRVARELLPASYSRELPRLKSGAWRGFPSVYAMVLELVAHTDGRVDLENLAAFTEAYQRVRPLKLGELWALPIMLRLALIENLRRVAVRISWRRRNRDLGLEWAQRFVEVASERSKNLITVLSDFARANIPLHIPFVAELSSNMRGQSAPLGLVLNWLDQQLAENGQTLEQVVQAESQDQAADQASIANSISSLRTLNTEDWPTFVENASVTERILHRDPLETHARADFQTRDRSRHVIEELARRSSHDEPAVALQALRLAAERAKRGGVDERETHIGFFLLAEGRRELEAVLRDRPPLRRLLARALEAFPLGAYLGALGLLCVLLAAPLVFAARVLTEMYAGWVFLVHAPALLLVASRSASKLVNWVATHVVPPRPLPRMDFSTGVPDAHRTAVVVPTLLGSVEGVRNLVQDMEVRYLANRDPNLRFVLLTDLPDASAEELPSDQAVLDAAREALRELNARHAAADREIFLLLHRPRLWNPGEGRWMGHERKRGKLEDFNRLLLTGQAGRFSVTIGALGQLKDIRYVITLDTDTQLPPQAAWKMVGALAHPLNRPALDPASHCVRRGYGVLQPRVAIGLLGAGRSLFARLFAGEVGLDPYTREVSNVYHDLFGRGQFIGKGIYDVAAFHAAVGQRFPENTILSHDLIEGSHARCGFLSDVELIEEHPAGYLADIVRRLRWIRGDWQIAAWLGRHVPHACGAWQRNPLDLLSRWMIFDNLCRSLLPAAFLGLLLCVWSLSGAAPLTLTLLLLGLWFLPQAVEILHSVVRPPRRISLRTHWVHGGRQGGQQLLIELLRLGTMPYEAMGALGAIGRAYWRKHVSRRRLLEWQTAHDAERVAKHGCAGVFWEMKACSGMAVLVLTALWAWHPAVLSIALPFIGAWSIAPLVVWYISRPTRPPGVRFTPEQTAFLGRLARRTWAYFEQFCGPEQNWLPPDNYQEFPDGRLAERTSPTNIGLGLLSSVAAKDFGYVTVRRALERLRQSLGTMERLQRYRGHFLNWYGTRDLQPLSPPYISTVDSGNLAAHLIVLRGALEEWAAAPLLPSRWREGLQDAAGVLLEELERAAVRKSIDSSPATQAAVDAVRRQCEALHAVPESLPAIVTVLSRLLTTLEALESAIAPESESGYWVKATRRQCTELRADILHHSPWLEEELWRALTGVHGSEAPPGWAALIETLTFPQRLPQMAVFGSQLSAQIEAWKSGGSASLSGLFSRLSQAVGAASGRADELIVSAEELAQRARELAEMDLSFLYDSRRKMLSIGFALERHQLDAGSYDLLASEARICSFLGIAQGKLPHEHWFLLGRRVVAGDGPPTLLSWSGSMFEYLMPLLVMPSYGNTLLDRACRGAVRRQIRYGQRQGIPWGISESCYNQFDRNMVYQYRAFGVPELGLKRGLADDLVLAPYASALALLAEPEEACANLGRMARKGFVGRYGLYEAVDYTASRVPHDQQYAVVRCHMAHHGGMTLLALAYALLDRPMQRRFMRDPEFRAASLLLHERIPLADRTQRLEQSIPAPETERDAPRKPRDRRYQTADTPVPEVHMLFNGRYSVMVNNAGGGFSRWNGLALTRWREDIAQDEWGTFFYLQDADSGTAWSACHLPMRQKFDSYQVVFSQGRTEFRSRYLQIEVQIVMAVSPEDDIEIRRLTLHNYSARPRTLELTSYAEVVLLDPRAELSHPAFHNLFVETEALKDSPVLLARRRPRAAGEHSPTLFHMLVMHGTPAMRDVSCETDRARFIGRGCTPAAPAALRAPGPLSGTVGAVLDPVFAIRRRVTLEPGQSVSLDAVTGVAPGREEAVALADRYQNRQLAERVFDVAWTHAQVMLHQHRASHADAELFARIAGSLIYANSRYRGAASLIARNRRGQSDLWRHGVSGDLPIVLAHITEAAGMDLARRMIQAHAYWRHTGLRVDLVFWVDARAGYRQGVLDEIIGMINMGAEVKVLDQPAGIFVRGTDQLTEDDQLLLQAVAHLSFSDRAGTLDEQVSRRVRAPAYPPLLQAVRRPDAPKRRESKLPFRKLTFFNGRGGFSPDGYEYITLLDPGKTTPAPWINVLANPEFGTILSESGSSYTWFQNAHEYRLTPWHNDPVSDPSGEAFYVRDEETGRYWSPTAGPARGSTPYVCRHGMGYSAFEHTEDGIFTELLAYVATDAPVKMISITVRNLSERDRRLSLTGYCEWVLGETRERNAPHVVSRLDLQTGALFATNAYGTEFSGIVAFFHAVGGLRTHTGDRLEFIGRTGSLSAPEALRRQKLSGALGAGFDPCAALQVYVDVPAGQQQEVVFLLGAAASAEEARGFLRRFGSTGGARRALEGVWHFWKHLVGGIYVETPDESVNYLVNRWLLYQVTSCRFWGRSGLYQSGGAYGYRDQLQDSMAFLLPCPWLIRPYLLRCASRQFREGDVQHWWHPPSGRGVRTRISDDYLWLPLATCRYVLGTGDTGVLDETVPFLEGRALAPEEESCYSLPATSEERATLYEHCVRAIRRAAVWGPHGLPLMGCGDWNDGMNRVGIGGKGESVWLGFFLCEVLRQFEKLARIRNDGGFADECHAWSTQLRTQLEAHGWDGAWYRRAYFDDGRPLGSAESPECQIDLLPQSWAVLSGMAPPERAEQALQSVLERLVDPRHRLVRLFTPPFDSSDWDPGYIRGYVPGVRENGGQYTHAAVWATMAFAARGDAAQAWRLFSFLNPIAHGDRPEHIATYKVEPYVLAADVYTLAGQEGRGGWTWYTGSASWMYRLLVESLLGVSRENNRLVFAPVVPVDWKGYRIHYRHLATMYHIEIVVVGPASANVRSVSVDGVETADRSAPLVDDHREHFVRVEVG